MNWRKRTFIAFAVTTILFTIASILFSINSLFDYFMHPVSILNIPASMLMNISYFLSQFAEITLNYSHIIALTIVCYTVASVLLIKGTHKKTGWIFAMIPPIFLLLNPLFVKGKLILVGEALIAANYWQALDVAIDSIIPILVIIYAITALANVKNKIFDKTIGIIFIALFLLYPLVIPIAKGNISFYFFMRPIIQFIFFILLVILLPKMFRKD